MPKSFLDVKDVMVEMGCGRTTAYKEIQKLNEELDKRGYITHKGKISRSYFEARYKVKVET